MNEPKTRIIGDRLWLYDERTKGYYPAPDLPRPNSTGLQERQALRQDRLRLHRPKGQKKNAAHHLEFKGATVEAIFYISDNRKRDLDGMMTTILDCCVLAGCLSDDSIQIVSEQRAKAIACPRGSERVEITITFPNYE